MYLSIKILLNIIYSDEIISADFLHLGLEGEFAQERAWQKTACACF